MRKRVPISSGFHIVSAGHPRGEVLDPRISLYDQLGDEEPDLNDEFADITQPTPVDIVESFDISRVDLALITEAMADLPPPLRSILEQIYIEGKSIAEVEENFPTLEGRGRRVLSKATKALLTLFTEKQQEAEERVIRLPGNYFRPA